MLRALLDAENAMTNRTDIDYYIEACDPRAIRFDGLDDAVIGTDQNGNLVYDFGLMHEIFVSQGMNDIEAEEYIDYDVVCVNGGQGFTMLYK